MTTEIQELHVSEIVVVSGVRPFGRTFHARDTGRPQNGFLYIRSGEARFWEQGKRTVTVAEGELVFIPKAHVYKMQYTKPNTTFVLVNFDAFDKQGHDVALFDRVTPLAQDQALRIGSIMTKLETCGTAYSLTTEFRKKELLYRLLSVVCTDHAPTFEKQTCYPQILAGVLLLKETYLENLPITRFAEVCNISISTFRSLFRKQYGVSPLQYRNMLRIHRAKELLEDGTCTVAEAAFASGFDNIGYFCNCYKKMIGETPSQTKHTGT